MAIKICASDSLISFFGVRQFLAAIGFKPNSQDDLLTCHLIRPFHGYRNDLKEGSLTDTMDVGAQLRFFLTDRVLRRFSGFARDLVETYQVDQVDIYNAAFLDEESYVFFQILRDVGQVGVAMYMDRRDCREVELDEVELSISSLVHTADTKSLLQIAETYLCVGNHWGVLRLLDTLALPQEATSPEIARLRAVAHVLANRSIEAERYYERWKSLGDSEDLVKANYGLSMLYMRHHPVYLQDMHTAERLLNEAFDASEMLANAPFLSIFNRNGYALILFRKGKIEEAKSLLTWAVAELDKIPGRVALMHKSVIMYNIAQCHFAQNNHDSALELLEDLVIIDPGYPEYHMEIARNFIATERYKQAIKALKIAHSCDTSVAEIYNQMGYCYLALDHEAEAIESYEMAHRLQPHDLETLHALVYALSLQERYADIVTLLKDWPKPTLADSTTEQIDIVYAEALSFAKSSLEAFTYLDMRYAEGYRSDDIDAALSALKFAETA